MCFWRDVKPRRGVYLLAGENKVENAGFRSLWGGTAPDAGGDSERTLEDATAHVRVCTDGERDVEIHNRGKKW